MQKAKIKVNADFQNTALTLQKDSKKSLRAFYKTQIETLSPSLKAQKEKQILKLLCELPFWKECSHIASYRALEDEVDLSSFHKLWKDKICFPIIKGSVLEFYKSTGSWQKNSLSVFEPVAQEKDKVPLESLSVFLIPGRAFDRKGGRLGRGKAYYDQTLAEFNQAKFFSKGIKDLKTFKNKKRLFIGVGFTEQIHNEALPLLEHDVLLDFIVTDSFILKPLNQGNKN